MKHVQVLHNPEAGDSTHTREDLLSLIKADGYTVHYKSLKEDGWEDFYPEADLLIVCGGDGSVRKVAEVLLKKARSYPILLLPGGTANNFFKSIMHSSGSRAIADFKVDLKDLASYTMQDVKVGHLQLRGSEDFFMEGFGIGALPKLIRHMEELEAIRGEFDNEIKTALREFLKVVQNYKAFTCTIRANGKEYSGRYLLVEIMNIRSIGPGLNFAPAVSPFDDKFIIVMVREEERTELENFIKQKINHAESKGEGSNSPSFRIEVIETDAAELSWKDALAHIDDQVEEGLDIGRISVDSRKLQFLIIKKPSHYHVRDGFF